MNDRFSADIKQSNNKIQFTNSNNYLGNKRNSDYSLEKKEIYNLTNDNLLKIIKNSDKDEIINKKLEFKLSHILKGENTIEDIKENKNTNKTIDFKNKEFYNDEFMDSLMSWKKSERIGPGFNNLGNTCFLNSVLQSLIYTAPLRNYLSVSDHIKICKVKGICFVCELGKIINFSYNSKVDSITPKNIIQNINQIAKSLRIGRQEDAHEFLLYLLDSLEKSAKSFKLSNSSNFISKSFSKDVEDNLIQKIFGGKMISSVSCLKCNNSSKKIDNFLDVSLQICNSENVERCFENFCRPESLNGNNKFFCEHCKCKNDSIKKFSFDNFPKILIIHLKRFDNFQRKIKKFIKYDSVINLSRFVNSQTNKQEYKYRLYSVLIHDGYSINSGHYFSYVKNSDGFWYCMNDSWVSKTDNKDVLHQTPYLLFYERILEKNVPSMDKDMFGKETALNKTENIPIRQAKIVKTEIISELKNLEKTCKNIESNSVILNDNKDLIQCSINNNKKLTAEVSYNCNEIKDETDIKTTNSLNFYFYSRKRLKIKKILLSNRNKINKTSCFFNHITPSVDNDSIQSELSNEKINKRESIKTIKQEDFNLNFNNSNNPKIIYNKNLTNFYGSDNIELWDTEEDSDLLRGQIKFIKVNPEFKESEILEKDEYDLNYDVGRTKKVKLNKEFNKKYNMFQKVHNKLGNEIKNSYI